MTRRQHRSGWLLALACVAAGTAACASPAPVTPGPSGSATVATGD